MSRRNWFFAQRQGPEVDLALIQLPDIQLRSEPGLCRQEMADRSLVRMAQVDLGTSVALGRPFATAQLASDSAQLADCQLALESVRTTLRAERPIHAF